MIGVGYGSGVHDPTMLLRTDHYTEGVEVDADGAIFFNMTETGQVMRIAPGADRAEPWGHVAAACGQAIEPDGSHIVASAVGSLMRLDASGRPSGVIATKVDGRWMTYPNDVALDHIRGGCFATDSGYGAMPAEVPDDPQGRLYRVDPEGRIAQADERLAFANGIALTPDGATLYVGESLTRKIFAYPVRDDGSLGDRRLIARTPEVSGRRAVPDGFAIGPDGRLFVAHYGAGEVLAYAPDGALSDRWRSGNETTSHVAFSRDNKTLFVSGGLEDEQGPGAIFALEVS